MLKIIEGRAGSGKTKAVFAEIKALAESGDKKIVLMVPKQFTAITERELVGYLGNRLADGIEVLSFDRISDFVFKNLGGTAMRRISLAGRYIVMNRAIESVRDRLRIYQSSADYVQFIESLITVSDEFAAYGITPEAAEEGLSESDGILKDKMHDLTLICDTYKSILGRNMLDGAYDLEAATEKLRASSLFEGYTFYFDSFGVFPPDQLKFIDALLPRLKSAVFTLTGEGIVFKDCPSHFSESARMYARLTRMAKSHGMKCFLEMAHGNGTYSGDIAHLEKNLFSNTPESAKSGGNVVAVRALNTEEEAVFAAGDILKRCRENGYKYKDFAVICRNAEDYEDTVSRVFAKYGVPVFVSVKEDLINTPISMLVLSALRCITSGFSYQSVFGYLKSNLSPLDSAAVCELETYAYIWNIRGNKWTSDKPWEKHPEGYNREHTDKTAEKLERINKNRKIATAEILALKEKVKNADAAAISRAVYELLETLSVRQKLEAESTRLANAGDFDGAEKTAQLWNTVISCLDQLALLGGEKITLERYTELLRLALSSQSIFTIPTEEDAVTFGAVDRIRTSGIKVSYILGMNEGVFPKSSFEQGIISDKERENLLAHGIELAKTAEQKVDDERFLCYCALTSASDTVTVSYSEAGIGGANTKSSFVYKSLFNIFDGLQEIRADGEMIEIAESENAAFEYMLMSKGKNSQLALAFERYFSGSKEYAERYSAIKSTIDRQNRIKMLENKCNATDLYSGKTLSPTRLDSFAGCRFKHFCKYGLMLSAIEKSDFSSREIGTFMHSIVEKFFKEYLDSPREKQSEIVGHLVEEYMGESSREFEGFEEKFKMSFKRFSRVLNLYITNVREELASSDFKPVAFELKIGMGGNIPPYQVGKYSIGGKIDRVDAYKSDKGTYVRVVDYKTGTKDFSFSEIANGMSLQMLLYLFALCGDKQNGEILPAGVLYSPVRADAKKASRCDSAEKLAKEAIKQNTAKGILLDDIDILHAMDRSGKFDMLPVKFKDGKPDRTSAKSLITAVQFDMLEGTIRRNLEKTVAELENGDISIAPRESGMGSPCAYCEMNAICGLDDPERVLELDKMTKDEFFEKAGGADSGN